MYALISIDGNLSGFLLYYPMHKHMWRVPVAKSRYLPEVLGDRTGRWSKTHENSTLLPTHLSTYNSINVDQKGASNEVYDPVLSLSWL